MQIVKSYITNENGKIQDVIISYEDFQKIEEILLDNGIGKSMEEVIGEDEYDLETAKNLDGFSRCG